MIDAINGFLMLDYSDKGFIQLIIPVLCPVSLLEIKTRFTQLTDTKKRPSSSQL
jgi:hypothetical protein